jgi:hypothetical protein
MLVAAQPDERKALRVARRAKVVLTSLSEMKRGYPIAVD